MALARDPMWLLLAVAFPAVFVNLGHGHNGFLTAALIGTALLVLDRKPVVAGILFGLMSYKPQFGVMIPLVLIATGRWRAFASAAATVLALVARHHAGVRRRRLAHDDRCAAVHPRGGARTGRHRLAQDPERVLLGADVGRQRCLRLRGAGRGHASRSARRWSGCGAATPAIRLKAAALPIASILATPYSLDYDLMALAPAIAFLVVEGFERGFRAWEKTALAFLWFMPLIARTVAEQTLIPLAVPAM